MLEQEMHTIIQVTIDMVYSNSVRASINNPCVVDGHQHALIALCVERGGYPWRCQYCIEGRPDT